MRLQVIALRFRPSYGELARRESVAVEELIVLEELRLDPVRAVIVELAAEAIVSS